MMDAIELEKLKSKVVTMGKSAETALAGRKQARQEGNKYKESFCNGIIAAYSNALLIFCSGYELPEAEALFEKLEAEISK